MSEQIDVRGAWRRNWLSCLQEFADAGLQRRMWLDPENQNPHWSYVEFMCTYFDDTLHGKGYEWAIKEGRVTDEEVHAVEALHHLLDTYRPPGGNHYDPERILNDPGWRRIVEEARQATDKLAVLLSDEAERLIVLGR